MDQGAKKFLYSRPKRKENVFDDDEPAEQWSFNNTSTNNTTYPGLSSGKTGNSNFDLDSVWSIKNMTVGATGTQPGSTEGWTRNAGQSFYSRHGVLNGDTEYTPTFNIACKRDEQHKWGGQKQSFSYSYSNKDRLSGSSQSDSQSGVVMKNGNSRNGHNQTQPPGNYRF